MNKNFLPAYLQQTRSELSTRFSQLETEAHARWTAPQHYEARYGVSPENRKRNRYNNVLPWDHTRVKLPVVDPRTYNDYVNASWIDLKTPGGGSDDISHKRYLATQGPLNSTIEHFWHMVYDNTHSRSAIVMLTTLEESGVSKCAKYWPEDQYGLSLGNHSQEFAFGLKVALKSTQNYSNYVLREFELTPEVSGSPQKTVYHFYFKTWEDFGNPSSDSNIAELVHEVNRHSDAESPLVVHCSAGIGRSGTFIAIDYMLTKVLPLNLHLAVKGDDDPIYYIVNSMREQRPGMVQRLSQYAYIYEQVGLVVQQDL